MVADTFSLLDTFSLHYRSVYLLHQWQTVSPAAGTWGTNFPAMEIL
jgi:hypothetical protein